MNYDIELLPLDANEPAVVVPYKFRELPRTDWDKPSVCCGIRAGGHYDGWDGNYLDCDEAKRRGKR